MCRFLTLDITQFEVIKILCAFFMNTREYYAESDAEKLEFQF